ncbi:MAG: NUDIX hydrolase [Clostridia bacterium]|nr:NUDIX hydrolase [Clostridia bacterium]
MKKKVTAAIVIIDEAGNILGCHGTGKPKESGYDFPKGEVEAEEADISAAVRELREETDIYFLDYDICRLIDAGVHPHNKEKDIHIFIYRTNYFPDLNTLKCSTFFERYGKKFPEVDGYRIISKSERGMFNKVLQNKFDIIDSFNK